jgi:hypothetical protein
MNIAEQIQSAEQESGARVNRMRPFRKNCGMGVELIATREEWKKFVDYLERGSALFVYTSRWNPFGHGFVYEIYVSAEELNEECFE